MSNFCSILTNLIFLVHQNYLIEDKNKNINFLSVVITDANDRHIPQYKAILWTKQVNLIKKIQKFSSSKLAFFKGFTKAYTSLSTE